MEAYNRKKSKILRSEQTDYKIALKPFDTADYTVCAELLLAVMNSILQRMQAKIPEGSRGHIAINLNGLNNMINLRFTDMSKVTAEDVLNAITKTLNSNEDASLDNFVMHVVLIG